MYLYLMTRIRSLVSVLIDLTVESSNVGEACSFATDCKDNMFCPSGTCQCNPGYVGTSGASSCLPSTLKLKELRVILMFHKFLCVAINPGQSGCTQNIQCTGGWPGSTCVNGACNCPTTYSVAQTQDGFICYKTGVVVHGGGLNFNLTLQASGVVRNNVLF